MKPDARKDFGTTPYTEAVKAFWPLAVGLAVLVAWVVISTISNAWHARKPEYQLRQAVLDNDIDTARLAIGRGANVDFQFPRGYSVVLHHAAWAGKQPIVELLVAHGANPNIQSAHSGETPLHAAVRGNEPVITRLLLEAGAHPGIRLSAASEQCVSGIVYPAGSTPADIARQAGYHEVLKVLEARR